MTASDQLMLQRYKPESEKSALDILHNLNQCLITEAFVQRGVHITATSMYTPSLVNTQRSGSSALRRKSCKTPLCKCLDYVGPLGDLQAARTTRLHLEALWNVSMH